MTPVAPEKISYSVLDQQAVSIFWLPVAHASHYEIKVEGHQETMVQESATCTLRGLIPLVRHLVNIRSVFPGNVKSEWATINVQTSYGVPKNKRTRYSVLEPINTYNNALVFDLPDAFGTVHSCTLRLWWQPSDNGWWADLEVPTGTPLIMGRRLGVNCGILDDAESALSGNIVMRSVTLNGTNEPDSECFKNKTHQMRWEPGE